MIDLILWKKPEVLFFFWWENKFKMVVKIAYTVLTS